MACKKCGAKKAIKTTAKKVGKKFACGGKKMACGGKK